MREISDYVAYLAQMFEQIDFIKYGTCVKKAMCVSLKLNTLVSLSYCALFTEIHMLFNGGMEN